MKVVGLVILEEATRSHADVGSQIAAWLSEVNGAEWKAPQDIKKRYSSASFLSDNRVVFNLKGNTYRFEVKVDYKNKIVLVKRFGTHAEYDKW